MRVRGVGGRRAGLRSRKACRGRGGGGAASREACRGRGGGAGLRSRKRAGGGAASREAAESQGGCARESRPPFREPHVAAGPRPACLRVALEPGVSVAEAVSSLTIADAFVAACAGPAPPRPALSGRFICSFPDCCASYNKAWRLDAHLCKHTGERPFVCDYEGCGKAFIRDYHLSRHVLIHTGEKPFVCSDNGCNQKFNTKSNLKKHIERKHENLHKQYICNFEGCKKAFKKHQQLKAHQCQHTSEPLFRCTHEGCGKHFASPSRLKRHAKVHEGYLCQRGCSFVGKTWTELLKHTREAHKEQVACTVCQKTFKRRDYLKQHMKTHAPQRDVYCCPREGCGRTYTTVFNLHSHILSFHEEQRPFACEHAGCGKTFAMKQSLWRHSVVHNPNRKLKVPPPRERRSLASRLSGYLPPKKKHAPESSLPNGTESSSSLEDKRLPPGTLPALC
ncbi:transcription factor IIIA [Acomys russatus]|uniref:transcription factor IIIA n=1 Tax=Acomys russatus TaxID=60746 RepID=UPI0021E2B657|nr:transcription factor IIIA [Acomys russatus]